MGNKGKIESMNFLAVQFPPLIKIHITASTPFGGVVRSHVKAAHKRRCECKGALLLALYWRGCLQANLLTAVATYSMRAKRFTNV